MREIRRVNLPKKIEDYVREQLKKEKKYEISSIDIASVRSFPIESYEELLSVIAEISYMNGEHNLLFRGQDEDYGFSVPSYGKKLPNPKKRKSSLYPSIYRRILKSKIKKYKFSKLYFYSDKLVEGLSNLITKIYNEEEIYKRIKTDLERFRYLQWSLLQHYQIMETPLLDLTGSIDVALSFSLRGKSSSGNKFNEDEFKGGYIYVLGFPYLTNKITYNIDHDIVLIKLSSVSSPDALRPHRQRGYAAATLSLLEDYKDKIELDFNRRLLMKFKIEESFLKSRGFKMIQYDWLFPKNDIFLNNLERIFHGIRENFPKCCNIKIQKLNNSILDFLRIWSCIEKLKDSDQIDRQSSTYKYVKKFRNFLVHNLSDTTYSNEELFFELKNVMSYLKHLCNT